MSRGRASKPVAKPKPLHEKRAQRRCLQCGKLFDSQGPGNRRCEKCKKLGDNFLRLHHSHWPGRGKAVSS